MQNAWISHGGSRYDIFQVKGLSLNFFVYSFSPFPLCRILIKFSFTVRYLRPFTRHECHIRPAQGHYYTQRSKIWGPMILCPLHISYSHETVFMKIIIVMVMQKKCTDLSSASHAWWRLRWYHKLKSLSLFFCVGSMFPILYEGFSWNLGTILRSLNFFQMNESLSFLKVKAMFKAYFCVSGP